MNIFERRSAESTATFASAKTVCRSNCLFAAPIMEHSSFTDYFTEITHVLGLEDSG